MNHAFNGRREDARFLTGRGRYSGDCAMPGELHAAFRRAEIAHGRILAVDTRRASSCAGVQAVLTAADVAGAFGVIEPAINYSGRNGSRVQVPRRPVLAQDRVRFVGEEIALVLADSAAQAREAADSIEVHYEELPALVDVDSAIASGATLVHDAIPENICFDFDYGDADACNAALAAAWCRVEVAVESPRISAAPMEPRAVLAWYDTAAAAYEICCSNQGGPLMAEQLAMLLQTTPDRIRVNPVDVGGGFGPRAAAYPEYAALLEAARRFGRPVRWLSSRTEDFLCDSHGRGIRLRGELGLDRNGTFVALKTEWTCDQGAYLTQAGARTNTINGFLIGAGPYRVHALYGRHRLVMTNTVPTDAYRGAARPEAALIIERLVEAAARELGMDAIELRRRNAIPTSALPYRTPTGSVLDSADLDGLLATAKRRSAWDEFAGRRAAAQARNALRGIGAALFVEPCGGGFVQHDQVALAFSAEGSVLAYHCATSNGQGHETVFPELIAERLGIAADRVILRACDPAGPRIAGNGTIGSRSLLAQGSAFRMAADEAINKGRLLAAALLEADDADIEFVQGRYRVLGTDRHLTFTELMHRTSGMHPNPLDTVIAHPVPRTFTTGAHVAEVEIDRESGETTLVGFVAIDDIGNVFNPTLADGQIHGGIAQAAGQVLGERCHYDQRSGQLLTATLMDYTMPRADTLPNFVSEFRGTASPTNALGAKGVGETGATGGLAAITNAVIDALASVGAAPVALPASPARVWAALQAAPVSRNIGQTAPPQSKGKGPV